MDAPSNLTIENQILIFTAGLAFLAGFLINVFIVAVNIYEWKKERQMSMADKIITSLGISRMFFQGIWLLNIIWDIYGDRLSFMFLIMLDFVELTCIYSSIWLSTLLSVVLCFKIFTFHNTFFLRLKILVLNRVLHLIVACLLISITYILISFVVVFGISNNNSTREKYKIRVGMLVFWNIGPLVIYFVSSVLLISSLYHHINRMRSDRNVTSRLDPYYKTMKFSVVSFFSCFFYILVNLNIHYFYKIFGISGAYFFWQLFPTLHSMYLIYVTAKLRNRATNMVCFLRRCFG